MAKTTIYQQHLFSTLLLDKKRSVYGTEIYQDMEEFEYLSIHPKERHKHRSKIVLADTETEAIQKAKDWINGQLELFDGQV